MIVFLCGLIWAVLRNSLQVISRKLEKQPSCLPFGLRKATPRHVGKAEDTASSLLARVRRPPQADSLTLAALNLRHPRLLQRQGLESYLGYNELISNNPMITGEESWRLPIHKAVVFLCHGRVVQGQVCRY
jgi:hypothetical protein